MSNLKLVDRPADKARYAATDLPPYRTPYTQAINVYKPGLPLATESDFLEAMRMFTTEERLTFTQGLAVTAVAEGKTSFEVWQALPENHKRPYINVSTWVVSHDNTLDQENWSFAIMVRHMTHDHVEEERYIHCFPDLPKAEAYRQRLVNNGYYEELQAHWHGYTVEEMNNLKTT